VSEFYHLCCIIVIIRRYYAPLDASGQRVDRSHRPELKFGSVQFLVNEDYCVRDIQVKLLNNAICVYLLTYDAICIYLLTYDAICIFLLTYDAICI